MKPKIRATPRKVGAKATASTPKPRVFLHLDKFLPLLPIPVAEQQIATWERSGIFPKGHRFGSQKAIPAYDAAAVVAWCNATFGEVFPDEVAAFARKVRAMNSCALRAYHRNKCPAQRKPKRVTTPI